jgi:hypothetical protein
MTNFIELQAIDPFIEDDNTGNTIYVKASNIIHIESYSGPFQMQAYGPDGRLTMTGKSKQVIGGSIIMLGIGGQRICIDSASSILEKITNPSWKD